MFTLDTFVTIGYIKGVAEIKENKMTYTEKTALEFVVITEDQQFSLTNEGRMASAEAAKARLEEKAALVRITAAAMKPVRGDKFQYGEFPATFIRHYSEGMVEVRLPGGVACISFSDLKEAK